MLFALPREVPDMDNLDLTTLNQIKEMAAGMSKDEIFNTFSIDQGKLSKDEVIYFDEFYNFGRGMAVNRVVQNLLDNTKGKAGQAAAMSFLRRFSKEFEAEIESENSGEFSFQFGEK